MGRCCPDAVRVRAGGTGWDRSAALIDPFHKNFLFVRLFAPAEDRIAYGPLPQAEGSLLPWRWLQGLCGRYETSQSHFFEKDANLRTHPEARRPGKDGGARPRPVVRRGSGRRRTATPGWLLRRDYGVAMGSHKGVIATQPMSHFQSRHTALRWRCGCGRNVVPASMNCGHGGF